MPVARPPSGWWSPMSIEEIHLSQPTALDNTRTPCWATATDCENTL